MGSRGLEYSWQGVGSAQSHLEVADPELEPGSLSSSLVLSPYISATLTIQLILLWISSRFLDFFFKCSP